MQKKVNDNLNWILDPQNIEFISEYNTLLQYVDQYVPVKGNLTFAPVFIIGAPRSGTTLVYQLMARYLNVGYINNFISRFWKAPLLGTYLSEKVLKIQPEDDFFSSFGQTSGLGNVHEYGYFWKRFFDDRYSDYSDKISAKNKSTMVREIYGMSSILERRMVFKNLTCGLRISPLCETFPNATFIQVKRNPVENGISILKARKKYKSSESEWWSLVPKRIDDFKKLSIELQIKSQIISTYEEIELKANAHDISLITLEYEKVCKDPAGMIKMLAERLKVDIRELPDRKFSPATHLPAKDHLEKMIAKVLA